MRQQVPYEFFTLNSLHPVTLLTTLFPFFHGQGSTIYHLSYWGSYWSHNEAQFYLGILAFSLAAAGAICLWRQRSRVASFWTLVAIVALVCALGKYVSPVAWALYHVPLIGSLRSPNRHWMEVTFAIAILAGYGVDCLLRSEAGNVARVSQAAAGALTILCAGVGAFALLRNDRFEDLIRSLSDLSFVPRGFLRQASAEFYLPVITAAFLLIVLVIFGRARLRSRWYPLLLGALLVDYQLYAAFAPIRSPRHLETMIGRSMPPELAAKQSEREPIRYHLLLKPDDGAFNPYWFHRHEMATGYDPLLSHRYQTFSGINEAGRTERWTMLGAHDRTLDLLNVRFVLVPASVFIGDLNDVERWREIRIPQDVPGYPGLRAFENLRALPRVWLAPVVVPRNDGEQLQLIRGELGGASFDPQTEALINPESASKLDQNLLASQAAAARNQGERISIVKRASHSMTIAAEAARPTMLVVSEVSHPGWRAKVDGREIELFRVNYVLRGLPLTAGTHTVEFFYWPQALTVGAVISAVTAILLAGMWWLSSRRMLLE